MIIDDWLRKDTIGEILGGLDKIVKTLSIEIDRKREKIQKEAKETYSQVINNIDSSSISFAYFDKTKQKVTIDLMYKILIVNGFVKTLKEYSDAYGNQDIRNKLIYYENKLNEIKEKFIKYRAEGISEVTDNAFTIIHQMEFYLNSICKLDKNTDKIVCELFNQIDKKIVESSYKNIS